MSHRAPPLSCHSSASPSLRYETSRITIATMAATAHQVPIQRGRPRSDESRQAILRAALDLVAARAGTGKQTIYRWWRGKADVVLDAMTADAARKIPVPDTGDLRADLQVFLDATFAAA